MSVLATRTLRLLRKPPGYVLRRVFAESRAELDRFLQPRRARTFGVASLLARTGDASLEALWERLATQTWPLASAPVDSQAFEALSPGGRGIILARAERACRHEVDLLGSGPTPLGPQIVWDMDFKTGDRWQPGYFRDIRIVDRSRPSDVKIPWELSRLQWLLPLGQAYLLTGEERYAHSARGVLEQWMTGNPVGGTVNWSIAMEPAMRIFAWTWLVRVFSRARAWEDPGFRGRLLSCLYQHGDFVARYIERGDLNGNHFTADCAALVVAGAFFGGVEARRWLASGWEDLKREITVQILDDGVDFEVSAAYHRLVTELFLLAGVIAQHRDLPMPDTYRTRLAAAARFTAAYTRPDGLAPLWGDADDARALPLGTSGVSDHRHLVACVAAVLKDSEIAALAERGWDEVLWLLGPQAVTPAGPKRTGGCAAFPAGGAYILRAPGAHVFIDCGNVGMQGRGGHGHNDILSFEATLADVPVVSDAGCFVYTASFEERNHFRSTGVHNTPQIDDEEVNRFIAPDFLWMLRDDAQPVGAGIEEADDEVVFSGGHSGYRRLSPSVDVRRSIALQRSRPRLCVTDRFSGGGTHHVRVPLQLSVGWRAVRQDAAQAVFENASGRQLLVRWNPEGNWQMSVTSGRIAPSYGVVVEAPRCQWESQALLRDLVLSVNLEISN